MRPLPPTDPDLGDARAADLIEHHHRARGRATSAAFTVGRVLPSVERQMVGPFIFLDHARAGRDAAHREVRCPAASAYRARDRHLYLRRVRSSTATSVGSLQEIHPGDVNWMTAGRGIAHSERARPEDRGQVRRVAGFQTWVALPKDREEAPPTFFHHGQRRPAGDRRRRRHGAPDRRRALRRAVAGRDLQRDVLCRRAARGRRGRCRSMPSMRSAPPISSRGRSRSAATRSSAGRLLVFRPGDRLAIKALTPARLMLLGGEPMDGPRHIWWNFVSSSKERIDAAREDWKAGPFRQGLRRRGGVHPAARLTCPALLCTPSQAGISHSGRRAAPAVSTFLRAAPIR